MINRFNFPHYCGAKCWMLISDKQKMQERRGRIEERRGGEGGEVDLLLIDCQRSLRHNL